MTKANATSERQENPSAANDEHGPKETRPVIKTAENLYGIEIDFPQANPDQLTVLKSAGPFLAKSFDGNEWSNFQNALFFEYG